MFDSYSYNQLPIIQEGNPAILHNHCRVYDSMDTQLLWLNTCNMDFLWNEILYVVNLI
jgi:hypothetical protein